MTKKDFQLIADVIRKLAIREVLREIIAYRFAKELEKTNPRFDRDRFMAACVPVRTGTGEQEDPWQTGEQEPPEIPNDPTGVDCQERYEGGDM